VGVKEGNTQNGIIEDRKMDGRGIDPTARIKIYRCKKERGLKS